ncbi:hypothetical protein AUJ78_01235 [Candidatus Peregrinibacteria bacterium CG1_02_41_10]|nr:MAG: hypothetical protein AUJ78_01235 [Candidatus Peregrinibacteria bacterium CG1_02_41_10]
MSFLRTFLLVLIEVWQWLIILRVVLSWTKVNPANRWVGWIRESTEPLLKLCRHLQPRNWTADLAPLIAFLSLEIIRYFLLRYFIF